MDSENDCCQLIKILREQSCWANVCTEPGMVAYVAARAASLLDEPPVTIEVHLSGGILKNALSAGLPHTDEKGPALAAAAGAISREPQKGLTILGDLTPSQIEEAAAFVKDGRVSVKWDTEHPGVYGKCIVKTDRHCSEAVVSGSHTCVVDELVDGKSVASTEDAESGAGLSCLKGWTFDRIVDTVMQMDPADLRWLLEGALSNVGLSEADPSSAASLTAVPKEACSALSCDETLLTEVAGRTFRAIDMRMSGTPWPILTSSGSGNQGIMISIPVLSVARRRDLSESDTARALALAHCVNMLVKAYTGGVSASCGGVSAGAGSTAAICWMLGGTRQQMAEAVTEVLAALYGMVCDGAKATCALKGSSAVMASVIAGAGATRSQIELKNQGVVGASITETLERLEMLNLKVLSRGDQVLLELAEIEKV